MLLLIKTYYYLLLLKIKLLLLFIRKLVFKNEITKLLLILMQDKIANF